MPEWILREGFEIFEYYGRGPVENYQDRNDAATLGSGGKVGVGGINSWGTWSLDK